jgi:hypothetical protein
MWPLVAGTNAHLKGFTRLNSGDPALRQHAPMEESVT